MSSGLICCMNPGHPARDIGLERAAMQPCHCSTRVLILACSLCRDIGLELYMDASQPPCAALFGDITDDAVLPPTAAAASAPGAEGAAAAAVAAASGAVAGAAAGAAAGGASLQAERGGQQQQQPACISELAGVAHVVSCTAVLHCLGREQVAALLGKVGECFMRLLGAEVWTKGGVLGGFAAGVARPPATCCLVICGGGSATAHHCFGSIELHPHQTLSLPSRLPCCCAPEACCWAARWVHPRPAPGKLPIKQATAAGCTLLTRLRRRCRRLGLRRWRWRPRAGG